MKREQIEASLKEAGIAEDKLKAVLDVIMSENGKDIESEKAKTATKETELVAANTTIGDLQGKIKSFNGVDVAKLQADAVAVQAKHDAEKAALEAQLKQKDVDRAIDLALATAKAKNLKAVKALLDIDPDKAEIGEDGTLKGLDEQLKKLTESEDSKFLFETETKPTFKGFKPGEGRDKGEGGEPPKTLKDAIASAFSDDSE